MDSGNYRNKFFIECAAPEKNQYPPQVRSSEIPRGRGVLKVKILEAKYQAKLEFPGGTGAQNKKTFPGGSRDIFWNCTISDESEHVNYLLANRDVAMRRNILF